MDGKTSSGHKVAALYDEAQKLGASLASRDTRTKFILWPGNPAGGHTGGAGPQAIGFVITITGKTMEAAYEHAKELTEAGCNCVSSGETEFTCTCPD